MYAEQWNEYRKRRLMFWSVWLGGTPLIAVVGILLSRLLPGNLADPMFLAIAGAWMLAFAAAGIRVTYWRCPRCRRYFSQRGMFVNQLGRRCQHCGLEKWGDG
jgi:hypothetical protein